MPRPSYSTNSRFSKKVTYTILFSTVSALYSALMPTLCGELLVSRIASEELNTDDLLFDMKVSASSVGALGIMSYLYQDNPEYPPFDHILSHHLVLSSSIFITIPIIVPLIANVLSRGGNFPEWKIFVLGGLLTQLLMLLAFLLTFELGSRSETVANVIDYLASVAFPDDVSNPYHHSHGRHQRNIQQFMSIKFQSIQANASLMIKNIKLTMMKPVLMYLLRQFQAEYSDPYSKFFLNKISSLKHDEMNDLEQLYDALEQKYENTTYAIFENDKAFAKVEQAGLLYLENEAVHGARLVRMQETMAAMLDKAADIQTSVLQSFDEKNPDVKAIKEQGSQTDPAIIQEEKKNQVPANTPPILERRIYGKEERRRGKHKNRIKPVQAEEEEKPPITLADLRTPSRSPESTPTPTHTPTLSSIRSSPNPSAFFKQPVTNMEPISLDTVMQIPLTREERGVFDYLDLIVADGNHNYKTYIVGGWAYDKVRQFEKGIAPCQYNDIDIVTEIPPHILEGYLTRSPHIKGLFTGKWSSKQIEVIHEPNLSDLSRNAKTRDFMTFYIDKFGRVSDPTKFELFNLRLGLLYTARQHQVMYKEDPLMILRTIYKATKRGLNFEAFKNTIMNDRIVLNNGLLDVNLAPDKMINPRTMNLCITKLFSLKLAKENLEILFDLGIMEALFPSIHTSMLAGLNWIREQIAVSAQLPFPKLAKIYAIFIAPAVVLQNINLPYIVNENDISNIDQSILQLVSEIGKSSPLFKDAFANPDELYNYLRKPLSQYCQYCNHKMLAQNVNITPYPMAQNLTMFTNPMLQTGNLLTYPVPQADGTMTYPTQQTISTILNAMRI